MVTYVDPDAGTASSEGGCGLMVQNREVATWRRYADVRPSNRVWAQNRYEALARFSRRAWMDRSGKAERDQRRFGTRQGVLCLPN